MDLLASWWLIAQTRYAQMGRRVGQSEGQLDSGLGLSAIGLVAAAAALMLGLSGYWRWRSRLRRNDPQRLFVELCRAHALSRAEVRLLRGLAHAQDLADPAHLFIEPQRFAAAQLPPALANRAADVTILKCRLFGDDEV